MLKRVVVYNALANLQEVAKEKYYEYFTFIEPVFKKTFFTMLNNADVPVADDTIEHRLSYFFGEAPKILEALIEAGINTELGIATLALDEDEGEDKMSVIDFITQLIALYMANYEKDGRFAGPEFQEVFFGYIEKLYKNKDLMDSIPDEYKYVFMFLVRKLLWYHTTINPNRDSLYLNGTVDDLLNFVLMYGDWYNTYANTATAILDNVNTEETQPEIYEVEE